MRISKMRYFFPLGLLLTLLLDGIFSNLFAAEFFRPNSMIESRLFVVWLVMALCFGEIDHPYLWAVIAGLIFDIYYTGIIGPMFMILPLIVYLTNLMYRFLTPSFIVVLLICLIDITVITTLFYGIFFAISYTSVSLSEFIGETLGPTLAYNLAALVILYWPLKKFFEEFSGNRSV
ncbi:rod shape-determining protein MreD [Liquorilactobacillus vini]|nr:rod shape-determining protein MreD [Liquorilactobacillus vini]